MKKILTSLACLLILSGCAGNRLIVEGEGPLALSLAQTLTCITGVRAEARDVRSQSYVSRDQGGTYTYTYIRSEKVCR